jgi:hypothetical protein
MPPRVLPFAMTHSTHAVDRHEPRTLSPALAAIIDDLQVIDRLLPRALIPIGQLVRQFARGLPRHASERAESK